MSALRYVLAACLLTAATPAGAVADGPDYFDVTGVRAGDRLNQRVRADAGSPIVQRIPRNARGLQNLGCQGGPTFAQWQAMTEAQRVIAARSRWCQVRYRGRVGWVAGRFLKEARAPRKP